MDAIEDYKEWNQLLWDYFFPNDRFGNDNPIINLDETIVKKLGRSEDDLLKKCLLSPERLEDFSRNWFNHTGDNNYPDCESWKNLVNGTKRRLGLKGRFFNYDIGDGNQRKIPAYFGMICAIMYIACTVGPKRDLIKAKAKCYLGEVNYYPSDLIDNLFQRLHRDAQAFEPDRVVCGNQRQMSRIKFHTILKESERKELIDFIEINKLEWEDEPYREYALKSLIPALNKAGKKKFVELVAGTLKPYEMEAIPYVKNLLLSGLNFNKPCSTEGNITQIKDIHWRYYLRIDYSGNHHFSILPNEYIPFGIELNDEDHFEKNDERGSIGYDDEIITDAQFKTIPVSEFKHEGIHYRFANVSVNNDDNWPTDIYFEVIDEDNYVQVDRASFQSGKRYIQLRQSNMRAPRDLPEYDLISIDGYNAYVANSLAKKRERLTNIKEIKEPYRLEGIGRFFGFSSLDGQTKYLYWEAHDLSGKIQLLDKYSSNSDLDYYQIPCLMVNEEEASGCISGTLYITKKQFDNKQDIVNNCVGKETIKIDLKWKGNKGPYSLDGWGIGIRGDAGLIDNHFIEPHGCFIRTGLCTEQTSGRHPLLDILSDIADSSGCISEKKMFNALNFVLAFHGIELGKQQRRAILKALKMLGYIIPYYDMQNKIYINQLVSPYLEKTNYRINTEGSNAYLVKGIHSDMTMAEWLKDANNTWFKRPYEAERDNVNPEFRCLPDLVLLKTDDPTAWNADAPAANVLIGNMKSMSEFNTAFLNHGDVVNDHPGIHCFPYILHDDHSNRKYLYDKNDQGQIVRYHRYELSNGIYPPIPIDLESLYCQNNHGHPICVIQRSTHNAWVYGRLSLVAGMALPEVFKMALCDLNLGLPKWERVFLLSRDQMNLPRSCNDLHPLSSIFTYDTNAKQENQQLILDGINKAKGGSNTINDLTAPCDSILSIEEYRPMSSLKQEDRTLSHYALYFNANEKKLFYIASKTAISNVLPKNYEIVAFTKKNGQGMRYLCCCGDYLGKQGYYQLKSDNMNESISQLIIRSQGLKDEFIEDFSGEWPKDIDGDVSKITIYKKVERNQ